MADRQLSPTTGEPPAASSGRSIARRIGVALGALVLVAALAAAAYGLVTHPTITAAIRDVTIIILAISTTLIGLALVVLIMQLQSLIGLLRDEVRPVLESANQTARTVRGTTRFLSDSMVRPVVAVTSYASGIRQAIKLVTGGQSRSPRGDDETAQQ